MSIHQNNDAMKKWQDVAKKELKNRSVESLAITSPEGIVYQPLYTAADLKKHDYTPSLPGTAPYTRGPRATMYRGRPWTIRQYAGFSSARESNKFYKQNLSEGQKGLSVAFDLPTHRGYDSDHPMAEADVGKAGVAIDSVEDMKVLFDGIPLDRMSVSMTMSGAVLPILACYIVAAEEQGVAKHQLRGTMQNDILKEYLVRNTFIYPPKPSMRIVAQILAYTSKHLPLFNGISISGYHMQEAGADSVTELAYTLANGLEYINSALDAGLAIDDFAPRLSFFFGIGMNFFMEIAKLRAARKLWYELIQPFKPKNPKSSLLRMHCQTSGYSLTAQEPYNNIIRTTIEAMAGVLGGTQSLHTNAFDEAIALPTPFSAKLARNTQLILQHETDICHTIDPLAGSYAVESLTAEVYAKARALIEEVTAEGGMMQGMDSGMIKAKIEEASAAKQARLDSKEDKLIGVNHYVHGHDIKSEKNLNILKVNLEKIKREQFESLQRVKASRDQDLVTKSLYEIEQTAQDPKKNLVPPVINAIRHRATIGECSFALEKVFGRFEPSLTAVSSVYFKTYSDKQELEEVSARVNSLSDTLGRRPRILLVKLGQDGHDRGIKVVATGLSDLGFDVDMGTLFARPKEAAKQALENDCHIIGVSSQAGGHLTLVADLKKHLDSMGGSHIRMIAGGVIPEDDYEELTKLGCQAIFGPGTSLVTCAHTLLDILGNTTKPSSSQVSTAN
ncbi:MAG: methylmalonyl-CoA mutase [Proteobacteria bacterium]|nr:methylmalonyl-CoA mutase [Pseudomonadota bacterium]